MKIAFRSTCILAAFAFSQGHVTGDEPAPAKKSGIRKVAGATGGHGTVATVAASAAADRMTVDKVTASSIFAPEDHTSKTLKGSHRQVAGATGGHGGVATLAASAAAAHPGRQTAVAEETQGTKR